MLLGDAAYEQDMHRQASAAFRSCLDPRGEAWALTGLSMALMLVGDPSAADEAQAALDTFNIASDARGVGHTQASLGIIAASAGDPDTAEAHYLQALSTFRLAGQHRDAASVLSNLGNLSQDRDDYRRASRFYDGALQLCRDIEDHRGAGLILNNLCLVFQARGNHDRANELVQEAVQEFNQIHDRQGTAAARHNLANLAAEAQAYSQAFDYYQQAIEGFRAARDPRGVIMVLGTAVAVARRCGRDRLGWAYQIEQATIVTRLGLEEASRDSLRALATHAMMIGETELAERLANDAESMLSNDISRTLEAAQLIEPSDRLTSQGPETLQQPTASTMLTALTKREVELLGSVGAGKTNSEIAEELFISRRTVDAHLSHIRTKLVISDRSKLIVLAREHLDQLQ
jgi:DNA-binding NarL/FixJ family response regulator